MNRSRILALLLTFFVLACFCGGMERPLVLRAVELEDLPASPGRDRVRAAIDVAWLAKESDEDGAELFHDQLKAAIEDRQLSEDEVAGLEALAAGLTAPELSDEARAARLLELQEQVAAEQRENANDAALEAWDASPEKAAFKEACPVGGKMASIDFEGHGVAGIACWPLFPAVGSSQDIEVLLANLSETEEYEITGVDADGLGGALVLEHLDGTTLSFTDGDVYSWDNTLRPGERLQFTLGAKALRNDRMGDVTFHREAGDGGFTVSLWDLQGENPPQFEIAHGEIEVMSAADLAYLTDGVEADGLFATLPDAEAGWFIPVRIQNNVARTLHLREVKTKASRLAYAFVEPGASDGGIEIEEGVATTSYGWLEESQPSIPPLQTRTIEVEVFVKSSSVDMDWIEVCMGSGGCQKLSW